MTHQFEPKIYDIDDFNCDYINHGKSSLMVFFVLFNLLIVMLVIIVLADEFNELHNLSRIDHFSINPLLTMII